MKTFYFESDMGCGLVEAHRLASAERQMIREVGEPQLRRVREATADDITWVKAMGGYVPTSQDGEDAGAEFDQHLKESV